MKIVSLNVQGGFYFKPLMEFVREHADADVLCFQEMLFTSSDVVETSGARANLYAELSLMLTKHNGKFAPAQDGYDLIGKVDFPISFGLAQFVRDGLRAERGDVFILGERNSRRGDASTNPRNLQYATFGLNGGVYNVVHFHGYYAGPGKGKGDTDERKKQSHEICRVIDGLQGKKILCGDFNLNPGTESLKILEEGMVNLIKSRGITDTRGILYPKPERHADYMLISPELEKRVKNFEVPNVAISDHLPLILELGV
ncbi:MAG TPA: endonuclease/exonuclease/phosphatase family protein [Candidatus Nanoarchaeia archaeon]|nr:endonuclease/exonuclease/phosphatase family protein [Candidatus Nanoarchaeia archaeon]